jgi:hypothetical protein
MIAAKQAYWADQADIQIKTIESWIAKAEGDHARALQLARAAAKHEDSSEKHVVTPGPILPARELLGDMLMELGQRAAEASGNVAKARTWYDKFAQVSAQGDTDVAQIQHAKMFLARR